MKLLFSTNRWNFFSWAIRVFSWSDYSHVEVAIGPDQLLGADFWDGVNIKKVKERIHSDKLLLCEFDIPEEYQQDFIDALKAELGKKYDVPGIFGHMFKTEWERTNKWFCSELPVAKAWEIGYPILNIMRGGSNRVTPRDLLLSNRLKVISSDPDQIKAILLATV